MLSLKQDSFFFLCLGIFCFYFYSLLRDLMPFLPPMIGFLFLFYAKKYDHFLPSLSVFGCLFWFESMHLKTLGVLALLFLIYHQIVYKNSLKFFNDGFLFKTLHVFLVYYLYLSRFFSVSLSLKILGFLALFALIESALWGLYEKSSL
ncbi:hypothetical protein ACOWM0_00570 [Helicobacter pylori]|uniref:hypothetical protein n=1 Tax=Helicobacter pylori TaxID=210 RepID=UPI000D33AD59|nr:hypothetical protein [Helicobacter pylori]MUU44193.1 hypothetical protein [Helicobacter pylori]PUD19805.1 hypothetical protein C2R80_04225 [Helicobacter pylori]WQZ54734.1 hypothetical protein KVK30_07640 [Helicobacter pylori]WQZ57526.1 hypothetical protein KVL13_07530 [Helicobacter pylori]WRF25595.1 hypothetical protein KVC79_07470 [Helicobacter pylori]